jgi:hypothetical protein
MTYGGNTKQNSNTFTHLVAKYSIETTKNTSKLATRYSEVLPMGYVEGKHNYRVWNPAKQKVIKTRDVVFVNNTNSLKLIEPPVLLDVQGHEPEMLVVDETTDHNNQLSRPGSLNIFYNALPKLKNNKIHKTNQTAIPLMDTTLIQVTIPYYYGHHGAQNGCTSTANGRLEPVGACHAS